MLHCAKTFLLLLLVSDFASHTSSYMKKIRVCIVESRGLYRKTSHFCPVLEANSDMECVVALDRLDCVRRLNKGLVDFSVLTSEELLAARWASADVLVTNELRSHNAPFEYEVTAVVDNEAGIYNVHDLRGSKLCHPGSGLMSHWTEYLLNYFQSVLVPKSCDTDTSLTESRIRATAKFFGPSCKAGPWVINAKQDRILKDRYTSLCQMCYNHCDTGDRHWGRRGALYCLTNGGGNVAWARVEDIRSHFGLTGLHPQTDSSEYSYLCVDGHLQPLNTSQPCTWIAKPWPVIAAHRSKAVQIQKFVSGLNHNNRNSWQNALLSLLETYHNDIVPLASVVDINNYLDQVPAFQAAYNAPDCNPPRSIIFCTTSVIEHVKCSWLQEISHIYGIQPNIQCIRSETLEYCMNDIKFQSADVIVVDQDNRVKAQRDYNLVPLLYEFSHNMTDRYTIIAIVSKDSKYQSFSQLQGARACLPSYEGAAYLSVQETIEHVLNQKISVHSFFNGDSCIWQTKRNHTCPDIYRGDVGALRCLMEGGDVAFLSSDTYKRFLNGNLLGNWIDQTKFLKAPRILCPYGTNEKKLNFEFCYLHWTPRGFLMTRNTSTMRQNEIYNSLKDMDYYFGRIPLTETRSFTMYGLFDNKSNVIFHDKTDELWDFADLQKDNAKRAMEDVYNKYVAQYYLSTISKATALNSWSLFTISLIASPVLLLIF